MATATAPARPSSRQMAEPGAYPAAFARGEETKPSVRSTEFYIYLAAVGAVLLASYLVGNDAAGVDVFRANTAWWFISLLTIGYLISRGLAKAGSSWRQRSEQQGAPGRQQTAAPQGR
jgi:hypothetical protein